MGLSLKPQHLKRYKDVAVLLMKYGRSDLVKAAGLDPTLDDESPAATATDPAASELANDLERMGPTFIKLGQLLSTRPDILPLPYLQALTRLQDRVEPFSFAEVEGIVISELGVRLSKAFSEFEAKPLAAASLGQVHRAAMRDGRPVAVKVQRPDIRERVMEDLDALEEIAEFLDDHTEMGRRYRVRPDPRRVPAQSPARARLPPGVPEPDVAPAQSLRIQRHCRARADRRLHDLPRADHGIRLGDEDHDPQPRGSPRARTVPRSPSSSFARTSSRSW